MKMKFFSSIKNMLGLIKYRSKIISDRSDFVERLEEYLKKSSQLDDKLKSMEEMYVKHEKESLIFLMKITDAICKNEELEENESYLISLIKSNCIYLIVVWLGIIILNFTCNICFENYELVIIMVGTAILSTFVHLIKCEILRRVSSKCLFLLLIEYTGYISFLNWYIMKKNEIEKKCK